MYIKRIAV